MTAAIITIGDEILIGQVTDTNSGGIAKALEEIGIRVHEMLSVSDERVHILEAFARYQDQVDVVLITGGLGPTKDDITKKTFCEYFDDELVVDHNVLQHITEMYLRVFNRPLSPMNRDQALVPSNCTVLHNEFGSAPGMWMQKGKTVFVSMPGVPYEMKGILTNHLIPKLASEFNRPHILHKTIMTYGMGESLIAERIESWENALPDFIKLAYLPSPGRVRLRLTARGKDKQVLDDEVNRQVAALMKLIPDIITGFDDGGSIEQSIGQLLSERGLTLSTAESCTGGTVAQMISSVPGASRYFKGSVVAYNKEIKTGLLGIDAGLIAEHSVVSAEVAGAMAQSVRRICGSDYGIGITGNAGPSTDDTHEAVGRVYIAIASAQGLMAEGFNFGQPREKVIVRAANKSLEMLRGEILKKGA